uniref:Uncharacterized protein n=1 Tax=Chromera velia CCMP2878 TaxID=1169474 RepID=A0A0G4F3P7_9ALVE|eukprot:Cvel_14954.t1-p1 / transcript=Cvel_14954.t1 / gene=Cvel_14954 / organism=Chromera_velia_CCMP2878 / gene_product=hypothetical protein / transcript_product=hypothetical protein / location=Cvel_scaffold1085:37377-38063(+) / protein_length=229 / sequence_SO=supercontig / SO=protein_coding / is_pseudo=false
MVMPHGGQRLAAGWEILGKVKMIKRNWQWQKKGFTMVPELREGLKWWKDRLQGCSTCKLWVNPEGRLDIWAGDWLNSWRDEVPGIERITTDAAAPGGGGFGGGLATLWAWLGAQTIASSNWRELKTVPLALRAIISTNNLVWRGKRMLVMSDNSTAVRIINKRHSTAQALGQVLEEIQALEPLRRFDIEIAAVHIPGIENTIADALFRLPGEAHCRRTLTAAVTRHLQH